MNSVRSIPPLRDLPTGRLAERKRRLLVAVAEDRRPRVRRRVIARAVPVLALAGSAVVLGLATGSASGTPTLPAPLPFAHGAHPPAVTLLERASARLRGAADAGGPVTYARTRTYALQTDVRRTASSTFVETTIRQVWVSGDGAAVSKSWRQDTTRTGAPVGDSTFTGADHEWQDTNTNLPSTPAALRAAFLSGEPSDVGLEEQDLILAQDVMSHLAAGTAGPARTAALYELLARLPGLFDAGPITDDAGRQGVAVGAPTGTFDAGPACLDPHGDLAPSQLDAELSRNGALGQGTTYLVVDPATGKPLQVESVDTPAPPCALGLPRVPTVEQYTLLLERGRVATVGAVTG